MARARRGGRPETREGRETYGMAQSRTRIEALDTHNYTLHPAAFAHDRMNTKFLNIVTSRKPALQRCKTKTRVRACVQFRLRESKAGNQHEQELNRERSKEYRHPALIVVGPPQKHCMGVVGGVSVSRVPSRAGWRDFVTDT
jgi:hypothetical protein